MSLQVNPIPVVPKETAEVARAAFAEAVPNVSGIVSTRMALIWLDPSMLTLTSKPTPEAFDVSQFQIDWQHQHVTCPQGQTNTAWYLS